MQQTSTDFRSSIEDIALDELNQLEVQRSALASDLAAVQRQIHAVRSVLKAIRPKPERVKADPGKRKQKPFQMSPERREQLLLWIAEQGDREITAREVHAHFGWSSSYCNSGVKQLREEEILRLSGTSGSQNIYRSRL